MPPPASTADPQASETPACEVCGTPAPEAFHPPAGRPYFACKVCGFRVVAPGDDAGHSGPLDPPGSDGEAGGQDRVAASLRLVLLANQLLGKPPDRLEVLDYGCGAGRFVETCRTTLGIEAWGTDTRPSRFGQSYFLPTIDRSFDIVVANGTLGRLAAPRETLGVIRRALVQGGVFAFQTGIGDPAAGLQAGPGAGEASVYSPGALDILFEALGFTRRLVWRDDPGVQAWQSARRRTGWPRRRSPRGSTTWRYAGTRRTRRSRRCAAACPGRSPPRCAPLQRLSGL